MTACTASGPAARRHVICAESDLAPGGRRLVDLDGRSVGVFNVDGRFYALQNRCPHKGGALCEGPIGGTTLRTGGDDFSYGLDGQILRCAWHGWEFDIATGVALVEPTMRARVYPVLVENGLVVVVTGGTR